MPRLRRQQSFRRAANALGLVMVLGTAGYMWIEGWGFWKALFFTVITLTTVGYGDYGLSDDGLRFTTFLLIGGLGVVTYSAGQLVPILFDQRLALEWKMKKQIRKLSNHFIVCGLGRVGRSVCASLAEAEAPFVVVERCSEAVEWAIERGYLVTTGDATEDQILGGAGIQWAKGLACVTDSDTENIVITLGARQLNPDLFIISRAEQDGAIQKMKRAGASRVISPIRAGGVTIAHTMTQPCLAELLDPDRRADMSVEIAEIAVEPGSGLDGLTVSACADTHASLVLVAVTHADGRMRFRPSDDEPLKGGDIIIVAGDVLDVGRLQDEAKTTAVAA